MTLRDPPEPVVAARNSVAQHKKQSLCVVDVYGSDMLTPALLWNQELRNECGWLKRGRIRGCCNDRQTIESMSGWSRFWV